MKILHNRKGREEIARTTCIGQKINNFTLMIRGLHFQTGENCKAYDDD